MFRISMALLIFMFHSHNQFDCDYSYLNDFVSVGAIAMTGFFLLSGYSLRLVYGNKELMDRSELKCFFLKRIISILPLYYATAILYTLLLGRESVIDNLILFPIEALGLQTTFTTLFGITHNGGTWFISCLLICYLIYPYLQTVFKQLPTKFKVVLLLVLVFIDLWGDIVRNRFGTVWLYENPFYRTIEFTIGVIVAELNLTVGKTKMMELIRSRIMLVCLAVLLFVSISIIQHMKGIKDFMLLNWIVLPCFALMLFPLGIVNNQRLKRLRFIPYFSKISYPFFLAQFFVWPIGKWIVKAIEYDNNWFRITLSFSICVLIAILMYEIVQVGIMKLFKSKGCFL